MEPTPVANPHTEVCRTGEIDAVVGPSMGGLVARYALTYMESSEYSGSHNTELFVSYDGAQQGGHLPVGLQRTVKDFLLKHILADIVGWFTDRIDEAYARTTNVPAIRQLLVYNDFNGEETNDPVKLELYRDLRDLGDYPDLVRNVAVVNGAADGTPQLDGRNTSSRIQPGERLFQATVSADIFGVGGKIVSDTYAAPYAGNSGRLYRRRDYACFGILGCAKFEDASLIESNVRPYDSAPGGYRETFRDIERFANNSHDDVARFLADLKRTGFKIALGALGLTTATGFGAVFTPLIQGFLVALVGLDIDYDVDAYVERHSFVHTVSALDYNTTSKSRYELLTNGFEDVDLTRSVIDESNRNSRTPFDAYYLPGYTFPSESTENLAHVEVTEGIKRFLFQQLGLSLEYIHYEEDQTVFGDQHFPAGLEVTVSDGVTVTFADEVEIAKGTYFGMGQNARIVFEAPVQMNGTSSQPIRFESISSDEEWKRVKIMGNGSSIEHAIFDGGGQGLSIQALNVEVRYSTFTNNSAGISADESSITIANSTIRDNSSGGIYFDGSSLTLMNNTIIDNGFPHGGNGVILFSGDATIVGNTISGNSGAGVYIFSSDASVFEDNVIENNGGDDVGDYGVRAAVGSFLYMNGKSKNRIRYNDGHEIYVEGRAYLGNTSYDAGGWNDIYDDSYGSGNRYIKNTTSYTIKAENNYWGQSSPHAGMFAGSVDRYPYLEASAVERLSVTVSCLPSDYGGSTSQCYASASGGGGSYYYDWSEDSCDGSSSCTASCGGVYISVTVTSLTGETETASTTTGACRDYGGGDGNCDPGEICIAGTGSKAQQPYATLDRSALREEIQKLKHRLREQPGAAGRAALLHQLYSLLLLDAKVGHVRQGDSEVVFDEAHARTKSIFTKYAKALRVASAGELDAAKRRAGAAAMLILVEDLLHSKQYSKTLSKAAAYEPHLKSTDAQKSLALLKAAAYGQSGQYAQALEAIRAAEALAPKGAALHYGPIKRWLRRRLGRPVAGMAGPAAAREKAALEKSAAKKSLPETFEVGAPYPNPTSGRFMLPLSLPEAASVDIEIYDVLGRRVQLVERNLGAGHPELMLGMENMSSGLYLIRIRVETDSGSVYTFDEKVIIAK